MVGSSGSSSINPANVQKTWVEAGERAVAVVVVTVRGEGFDERNDKGKR
jgi:hypothetical protein